MDTLITSLARNAVFCSLNAADLDALARNAIPHSYQSGEFFALYGTVWPYLFWVENGTVNALKESSEGRSLIVMTLEPGDIFWGLGFFHDDTPMPVSLHAHTESRLYLWTRERLLPLLLRNSGAMWELSRLMVTRMTWASEIVEGLAFQPVAGRLARLMLDHFEKAEDSQIARDLTLDEMAARIGTTREMVCRTLYQFSDQGLIEITRTEFTLNDQQGLARLVKQA